MLEFVRRKPNVRKMGCLFSKSSTTSSKDNRASTTRVHHIGNSNNNGIIRVPKLNLKHVKSHQEKNDDAHVSGNSLRIQPPPPAPPPSPPAFIESPRPAKDEKVFEQNFHNVQDAEDLEPVTPLPSGRSKSPFDDGRSKVSVSNVSVRTSMNGLQRNMAPLKDLSIEELDTDMDDFNRLSGQRYSFRNEEKLNPATTDILLPRRKISTKENPDAKLISSDTQGTKKRGREDTPMPTTSMLTQKVNLNTKTSVPQLVLEDAVLDGDTEDQHDKTKLMLTPLNVSNKREENLLSFDNLKDDQNTKQGNESHKQVEMKPGSHVNKTGTLSDILVETSEPSPQSNVLQVPKSIHDKELEKARRKRKRKRNDNSKKYGHERKGDINHDVFIEGSLKHNLKTRPESATSTWTLDSKRSFGSNDTLNSFDPETETDKRDERYSYLASGTTPISFKSYNVDENTEIIDLEDNGGDPNNDSWLTDDKSETAKEEKFDVWYGIKPYEVISSTGRIDSGILTSANSGPSSSVQSTKQKLLYSRFARRPHSESVLRAAGKPPLPPGKDLKTRPVSDTVRKSKLVSRYYTTDLDIH